MELYLSTLRKEAFRNSFLYMGGGGGGGGGKLWNDLLEFVRNLSDIESIKRNYKMHKRVISSWWMLPWLTDPVWVIRSAHWCGLYILFGTYYWIMF